MDQEKRKQGKAIADRLRAEYETQGTPLLWFDALYREAEGDPDLIPWGHKQARFPLLNWLERQPKQNCKGRALDVGTGLGDNAAVLAKAGFNVTAFDISQTAVEWAKKRFADLPIDWQAADLLNPPQEWTGAFDLVSETFTIQALKEPERTQAFHALASLVAPKGRLLIVARGRLEEEPLNPPPWPLTPSELDRFETLGFRSVLRETFFDQKKPPMRHFLAQYQRDETS